MRGIFWEAGAWEDYLEIQTQKPLLKRVNMLIKDIQRNGYLCSYGKPERLSNDLSGLASVRIDKKHRLVFSVDSERVAITECGGHYGDH
ncbi:MAG: Txe/YoeB family addiction module toxin [Synergistaceae bacterium]|nr:Txe/YoeB family addiction module toxin [Synergistaceae bacterium]